MIYTAVDKVNDGSLFAEGKFLQIKDNANPFIWHNEDNVTSNRTLYKKKRLTRDAEFNHKNDKVIFFCQPEV